MSGNADKIAWARPLHPVWWFLAILYCIPWYWCTCGSPFPGNPFTHRLCLLRLCLVVKKKRSVTVKSGTCGWTGQLWAINATLRFWSRTFDSSCLIHSVKISESIQLLCVPFSCMIKTSHSWSISGFCFFQWSSCSFSPVALAKLILVSRILLCLPTVH